MRIELNQDGLCMKPGQLLRVHGGAGNAIVCHSGSVWLTQKGDPRDIVLGAGETFVLERRGPTLVQALEQSAVSFARSARVADSTVAANPAGRALAGLAHAAARA
ncbi:MAG: DUF2917 domain-containing protein [Burkholderiales bacterium]|nr:DUF2917 domain-containing protein [Burkholderiales bacterium]